MAVPSTVRDYVRSLCDDDLTFDEETGEPNTLYWQDEEIDRYLEAERKSVSPWRTGEWPGGLIGGGGIAPSLWEVGAVRQASILDPSPDGLRFQARVPYRCWASSPSPKVWVSGIEATSGNGYTYSVNALEGTVTFSALPNGAEEIGPGEVVFAAFDYFAVYESAHTMINIAMGQWASVMYVKTSAQTTMRSRLRDALARVEILRRKGRIRPRARYMRTA